MTTDPREQEILRLASKLREVTEERDRLLGLLFDGWTVFQALSKKATQRTGPENVSDTLDALSSLIKLRRDK